VYVYKIYRERLREKKRKKGREEARKKERKRAREKERKRGLGTNRAMVCTVNMNIEQHVFLLLNAHAHLGSAWDGNMHFLRIY
jgi:hypothetical protein